MNRENFETIDKLKDRLRDEHRNIESSEVRAMTTPVLYVEKGVATGGNIVGDYNPDSKFTDLNEYTEPRRSVYINKYLLPGNPVKARINITYQNNLIEQAVQISEDINDYGACPTCKIGRMIYKGGSVLECTECQ